MEIGFLLCVVSLEQFVRWLLWTEDTSAMAPLLQTRGAI